MITTSSFIYTFLRGSTGNARSPLTLQLDFTPVFPARSTSYLRYISISGMRQNISETEELIESIAARAIGNFNSDVGAIINVAVPRAGDAASVFSGIAFSTSSPFVAPENSNIVLPDTFDIEILPSNRGGNVTNDNLKVFLTIGFNIQT